MKNSIKNDSKETGLIKILKRIFKVKNSNIMLNTKKSSKESSVRTNELDYFKYTYSNILTS